MIFEAIGGFIGSLKVSDSVAVILFISFFGAILFAVYLMMNNWDKICEFFEDFD